MSRNAASSARARLPADCCMSDRAWAVRPYWTEKTVAVRQERFAQLVALRMVAGQPICERQVEAWLETTGVDGAEQALAILDDLLEEPTRSFGLIVHVSATHPRVRKVISASAP